MKSKNKSGFTLVEVMIVVVMIGLLTAMGIPAYKKVREESIKQGNLNLQRQAGGNKIENKSQIQVLSIWKAGATIMESSIVGTATFESGKVKWTNGLGVDREFALESDHFVQIR